VICVASAFSPTLERTLTNGLLGAEELGLYAAATKIAMLIGLLVSAFQTAWGPFSLALYKQADAGHTYNWVLKLFALGMCVSALVLTLLAQPLIHFLATDRYSGAIIVVFPLAMGLAIQATSWITEIGIGIAKRSYLNLYAYAIAVVATLGSILLLAPVLGLFGVGLGVLVGHVSKAFISSWLAQRAYRLPWHYVPVISLMSATLGFGLATTWLGQQYGTGANSLALIASLLTVLLMGWGVLFNKSERSQIVISVRACFAR
jgi:O-antigen/teichoic acid export membrane protein